MGVGVGVGVGAVDRKKNRNMGVDVPQKEKLSTRPFLLLTKNGTLLVCVVNPNSLCNA